ncbi:MAG TPA: mitochondrial fission ELM1 family protein, partial [Caulobacterales bacterium]|nr:mitochondrial fission ELM1 family protein [Caulobacterales bacterium]
MIAGTIEPEALARGADTAISPRTWVITNGNRGSDTLAEGLMEALGITAERLDHVKLGGPYGWMAPNGPLPLGHVGRRGKMFAPPWPDLVISVGRTAAPYALAIRKKAQGRTFAASLLNPKTKPEKWDLIWTPAHDQFEGENVVSTLTSPHCLSPQKLAAAAQAMYEEIAAMPRPWIAVLVGGPNGKYRFSPRLARDLCEKLEGLAPHGSFLITTSRRTPEAVGWTIKQWMGTKPARLWMGGADNPYLGFLGLADAIVVSADSVNMAGEAASTGKPVYVLELPG